MQELFWLPTSEPEQILRNLEYTRCHCMIRSELPAESPGPGRHFAGKLYRLGSLINV
jgi:hypothetical protein